ncbi:unnamed protein product, partial [Oppiella nova]
QDFINEAMKYKTYIINHINNIINKNELDNSLAPVLDTNIQVFDTNALRREDLRLLIGTKDVIKSDELLQDLDEESSGDYEPIVKPKARDFNEKRVVNIKPAGFQWDHISERDWVHYKFEKSYLLINSTVTKHEAEELCHTFNGKHRDEEITLAVPISSGEQQFINRYLFDIKHVSKDVWIGQNPYNYNKHNKKSAGSPRYQPYENWAKGRPSLTKPCVQIRSPFNVFGDLDRSVGAKWEDVSCFRRNLVLCERPQHWTQQRFIRVAQELQRELD